MSDIGPTEEAIRALLTVPDAVKGVLLSALRAEWEEQVEGGKECGHMFVSSSGHEYCRDCGMSYGDYLKKL